MRRRLTTESDPLACRTGTSTVGFPFPSQKLRNQAKPTPDPSSKHNTSGGKGANQTARAAPSPLSSPIHRESIAPCQSTRHSSLTLLTPAAASRKKPGPSPTGRGAASGEPMRSSESSSRFVQELVLYAASAALSCLVLFAGLRQLDPNRAASQKAAQQKKEIAKRLGRPLVSTTPYEDVIACDVINPDSIDVEFDSIGGLDHVKQALYELVILPLRRPELFTYGKLLSPQKGVLLYGPPGTGKTMLAKAIARESGAVFINVRISNLMSKWFGDAQKLVAAVFSLAHKLQPAIIFIDEVDSFLGQRRTTDHEAMTNMKTEFMSLWDGFTTDQNARVMVLAATNRPSELDEAILRRFTQIFEIGIPVQSERSKILQVVLKGENVEPNIDYDHIARLCEGFTGSDILELCKQAAFYPIRELLDSEKNGRTLDKPRPLRQSDLERALSTSRKGKRAASSGLQSPLWVRPSDSEDDQALTRYLTDAMKESRVIEFLHALEPLAHRRMDFEEFCAAAISPYQLEALERWEEIAGTAFQHFEQEGNRVISVEELAQELNLAPTHYSIMQDWIRKSDGKLNFLGFTKFLHGVTIRGSHTRRH